MVPPPTRLCCEGGRRVEPPEQRSSPHSPTLNHNQTRTKVEPKDEMTVSTENRETAYVMSVSTVFDDLDPILDPSGGLADEENAVTELIRLMDAVVDEEFDIQLCYLFVLAETKCAQILSAFLNKGGWPTLARWLNGFIEQKQIVGIRQLVKTFRKLPVTLDTLKKPVECGKMPGKMIRTLRKHEDEVTKAIATEVYEIWNGLVEADNAKQAKKKKEKDISEKAKRKKKEAKEKGTVKLVDNMIGNMFEASQEEKKKAKIDEKKRKDAKKRRREEEAKKDSLLSNIMQSMPGNGTTPPPNGSDKPLPTGHVTPPGGASPELNLEKRQRKPGAKTVRWADQNSAAPLEMVREIEIDPQERANVNSDNYKRQLDLDAFREGETLRNAAPINIYHNENQGDTAPKRQWRSPRLLSTRIPEQAKKNISTFSGKSDEKKLAEDRTKMTLMRLYPNSSIPDSPMEPDTRAAVSTGAKITKIPQRTDEGRDEVVNSGPPPSSHEPERMDLGSLGINFDALKAAVSTANGSPPTQTYSPHGNKQYSPPLYSTSPPIDTNRFGGRGVHDPTPPRRHSPTNNRFDPYRRESPNRYYDGPPPRGYNPDQDNRRFPPGHREDMGSRGSYDRPPQNHQRNYRSPPRDEARGGGGGYDRRSPTNNNRDSGRPYIRDYRDSRR